MIGDSGGALDYGGTGDAEGGETAKEPRDAPITDGNGSCCCDTTTQQVRARPRTASVHRLMVTNAATTPRRHAAPALAKLGH